MINEVIFFFFSFLLFSISNISYEYYFLGVLTQGRCGALRWKPDLHKHILRVLVIATQYELGPHPIAQSLKTFNSGVQLYPVLVSLQAPSGPHGLFPYLFKHFIPVPPYRGELGKSYVKKSFGYNACRECYKKIDNNNLEVGNRINRNYGSPCMIPKKNKEVYK